MATEYPNEERQEWLGEQVRAGVNAVRPAFRKLVRELTPAIDAREHSAQLIDGAGGRLVAFVLDIVMDNRGARVPVYEVAGGARWAGQGWGELEQIKARLGRRCLVTTELMSSGDAILAIGSSLEVDDIPFDVAALQIMDSESDYRAVWQRETGQTFPDARFFVGHRRVDTELMNVPALRFARGGAAYAEPGDEPGFLTSDALVLPQVARAALKVLADELS